MELENERHARIFVDADACPVIKSWRASQKNITFQLRYFATQTMYWNLPIVP